MKKKIKDCSVLELRQFCNEEGCSECHFLIKRNNDFSCSMHSLCSVNDSVLEQEIEIPDEHVEISDKLEEELISKSELLAKLEELEENTRNISRTIKPNTPAKYNYHGRLKMIDIIITGILEDWGEEPESAIPDDYFRPM